MSSLERSLFRKSANEHLSVIAEYRDLRRFHVNSYKFLRLLYGWYNKFCSWKSITILVSKLVSPHIALVVFINLFINSLHKRL